MEKLRVQGVLAPGSLECSGPSLRAAVVENPEGPPREQALVGRRPVLGAFWPLCFGSRRFFSPNILTGSQLLFTMKFLQVFIMLL